MSGGNYLGIVGEVKSLLDSHDDGHGFDHVERVRRMALGFAEQEGADESVVELAALLHDVDDYKLFGEASAAGLLNARRILADFAIDQSIADPALAIVSTMGYNKYLEGIRPATIEGMVVSDADMNDAIGAQGILRTHAYATSKGNEFFIPSLMPVTSETSADAYRNGNSNHSAQHFFDKLLKIPSIMMTDAGRDEAVKRQQIMVDFLYELFREENAEAWTAHLDQFLN
jgi:uncharacterized protein